MLHLSVTQHAKHESHGRAVTWSPVSLPPLAALPLVRGPHAVDAVKSVFGVWGERAPFSSSQRVLLSTSHVCELPPPPLRECANRRSYNDNHLSIRTATRLHAA